MSGTLSNVCVQTLVRWSEVKVTQLCPTLCDPMGYTVHGILQAGILERVAFPLSRGSSQPRDQTQVSRIADKFFTAEPQGKTYYFIFQNKLVNAMIDVSILKDAYQRYFLSCLKRHYHPLKKLKKDLLDEDFCQNCFRIGGC